MMLIYWDIFLAFFIPGIVGYGGGPAYIPLVEYEVVTNYGFVTRQEFAELLALANALPGPITTKLAGYIGYEIGGVFGAFLALFATIAPSIIAMIFLLSVLLKFKDTPKVKNMTSLITPVIAVFLGILAYQFFDNAWVTVGMVQTLILVIVSYLLMEKWKVHPALVILGALIYGAAVLPLV